MLCFQSYVVRTPHHTVLVDSCIGNDKDRPRYPTWHRKTDDAFMRGLAEVGLTVDDIDVVMCTHLHADHVGWNTRLEDGRWVPTFPRARYLFSARELAYWQQRHAETPLAPSPTACCRSSPRTAPTWSPATMRSTTTCASCRLPATRPTTSPCASAAAATRRCSPAT